MDNKSRFNAFIKAAFLIIWGSIVLGTSFAVWNASVGEKPTGFNCLVAGLSIIFSGVAMVLLGKYYPKNKED